MKRRLERQLKEAAEHLELARLHLAAIQKLLDDLPERAETLDGEPPPANPPPNPPGDPNGP